MDPVAQSTLAAAADLGCDARSGFDAPEVLVRGTRCGDAEVRSSQRELLANDAIEQVVVGPLPIDALESWGGPISSNCGPSPFANSMTTALMRLSREGQLYLQLAEMQTIQQHFRDLGRDPTDIELETIAQTWSEHCSHKTLAGRIAYRDENGERQFENMLKETIFAATQKLRKRLGRRRLVRQRVRGQRRHRAV